MELDGNDVQGCYREHGWWHTLHQWNVNGTALALPPARCTSTDLSKHESLSDCCFPDHSFRFPLVGTALSKHGTPSDRLFLTFSILAQGGRVPTGTRTVPPSARHTLLVVIGTFPNPLSPRRISAHFPLPHRRFTGPHGSVYVLFHVHTHCMGCGPNV